MGERGGKFCLFVPVGLQRVLLHAVKSSRFTSHLPSETKVCCGFLSPLKIHRLGLGLNPQPLGPVASTLTTTPPKRLATDITVS
jgi:hypothetical protein